MEEINNLSIIKSFKLKNDNKNNNEILITSKKERREDENVHINTLLSANTVLIMCKAYLCFIFAIIIIIVIMKNNHFGVL